MQGLICPITGIMADGGEKGLFIVEGGANIADMPSRKDEPMWWLQFGARFVAPVVPDFCFQFWNLS